MMRAGNLWRAAAFSSMLLGSGAVARASGASSYLPLNLSPEIERKVEQVLILGNQTVMTRPVTISRVLLALPKACERDRQLCGQVRRYLERYLKDAAVTHASGELAGSNGSHLQLPDAHGQRMDSNVDASVVASYRPFDHLLLSAGGDAYSGPNARFDPEGTMVSAGDQYLQVDAGWRDQWLSPMGDSTMLISTNAPTMPSVTISSQRPFTKLGLEYQFSVARMSYSDHITWHNGYTAGYPRLATLHLGISPVAGWSFAGNMQLQYGGGARPSSFSDLFSSLFKRTVFAASGAVTDTRFDNREISLTSSYTFPAATPLETYVEYAARDTLHGELYRFHETALSAGLHIPELYKRYDLRIELSEWQNSWYTDYVWQDGMVNDGSIVGSWGASWRSFANAAGAHSASVQLAMPVRTSDELTLQYRLLQNAGYAALAAGSRPYSTAHMLTVDYAQPLATYTRGLMLDAGRDEYAAGFVRLSAFARLDGGNGGSTAVDDDADDDQDSQNSDEVAAAAVPRGLERFVSVGVTRARLGLDLGGFAAAAEAAPIDYHTGYSPTIGVGLRRAVTLRGDVGVRAELEDLRGGLMAGLRILDYRYRLGHHVAVEGFVGFSRYSGPTPAQGLSYGYGLQWRNLWHGWDLSVEQRTFNALQRDKLLPSDQAALQNTQDPVEWYTGQATTLSIAHAF